MYYENNYINIKISMTNFVKYCLIILQLYLSLSFFLSYFNYLWMLFLYLYLSCIGEVNKGKGVLKRFLLNKERVQIKFLIRKWFGFKFFSTHSYFLLYQLLFFFILNINMSKFLSSGIKEAIIFK